MGINLKTLCYDAHFFVTLLFKISKGNKIKCCFYFKSVVCEYFALVGFFHIVFF